MESWDSCVCCRGLELRSEKQVRSASNALKMPMFMLLQGTANEPWCYSRLKLNCKYTSSSAQPDVVFDVDLQDLSHASRDVR